MSRRRRIDSTPNTPERSSTDGPLGDILNLSQQITPSKSPRRLRKLREDLQALANDVGDVVSSKDTEIADLTNQAVPSGSRKRRKRFHRAEDADDSVPNPTTLEDRVRRAGRHFIIDEAIFFIDEQAIWTVEAKDDFDYATEFASKDSRIQAQIQDLLRLLPNDARSLRKEDWIAGAFMDRMGGQRSTESNRLRHASLPHLARADEFDHFASASSRFEAFKERIGYVAATNTSSAYYSAFKAPLLYDEFDGTVNVNHIFRNPVLLKIQACILRGPDGAKGLFSNHPHRPQAKCVEKIHHIRRTSTGAIANAATLAVWLFSADLKFVEHGEETGINYVQRYSDYVQRLREGVSKNKPWAIDLLKYWDDVLFPDADNSVAAGTGEGDDAEMQSVDDAFGNAPSGRSSPDSDARNGRSPLPAGNTTPHHTPHRSHQSTPTRSLRGSGIAGDGEEGQHLARTNTRLMTRH
ncbi:hypothetical protein DFH08DRAFT_868078 [Mycena albidolilacea]|uniref:Uncharacterized protein n=1 Tax=Mycena albidolilacea TaxID=1033008 RepID=A0AAD7A228_9AGAR|nr:hypothetical protein DFH08DRAFT_868078 [Mycena albidolilacea]